MFYMVLIDPVSSYCKYNFNDFFFLAFSSHFKVYPWLRCHQIPRIMVSLPYLVLTPARIFTKFKKSISQRTSRNTCILKKLLLIGSLVFHSFTSFPTVQVITMPRGHTKLQINFQEFLAGPFLSSRIIELCPRG